MWRRSLWTLFLGVCCRWTVNTALLHLINVDYRLIQVNLNTGKWEVIAKDLISPSEFINVPFNTTKLKME